MASNITVIWITWGCHGMWELAGEIICWRSEKNHLPDNSVSHELYKYTHIAAEVKWPPFSRRHLKWIFLNENVWIYITSSSKFVLKGPDNNIPALVQIMAWRRPGDKPLSEPMMVTLLTQICVTRPQWVNVCKNNVTLGICSKNVLII